MGQLAFNTSEQQHADSYRKKGLPGPALSAEIPVGESNGSPEEDTEPPPPIHEALPLPEVVS